MNDSQANLYSDLFLIACYARKAKIICTFCSHIVQLNFKDRKVNAFRQSNVFCTMMVERWEYFILKCSNYIFKI